MAHHTTKMILILHLTLLCLIWPCCSHAAGVQSRVHSGGQLQPLTILSVTPAFLATPSIDPVTIESSGFIRVVFSRAVIPVGVDLKSPPANYTPFTVSGSSQGQFRWLNSYVASYAPEKEWMTDISMQLTWNRNLRTLDGDELSLGGLQVRADISHYHCGHSSHVHLELPVPSRTISHTILKTLNTYLLV
jgi:hypothetical protein